VLGDGGRGAGHDAGLAAQPDLVRTVTLSKALSGQGGAVLGAAEVRQTLIDTGRGFIFDTGLAPPSAGAALAALGVLRDRPDLPERARWNTKRLAGIAAGLGLAATAPDAAVASVIVGAPQEAVDAQRICGEHGVSVGCFRPPSVPVGQACLRLTGRATLNEIDLATASRALAAVRDHSRIPENAEGGHHDRVSDAGRRAGDADLRQARDFQRAAPWRGAAQLDAPGERAARFPPFRCAAPWAS
jgi:8-amino-7-oxononanoate synthase